MIPSFWFLTTFALCCFYRCNQFVWRSESSPEEASLPSSVEPPRFDRWVEIDDGVQRPTRESTIFFSDNARLFALSGIISGKLCDDSLGDTEVFRPVVAPRNRQSPWQIAATGWVWCVAAGSHVAAQKLMRLPVSCFLFQCPSQRNQTDLQRQNTETLWNKHFFLVILFNQLNELCV